MFYIYYTSSVFQFFFRIPRYRTGTITLGSLLQNQYIFRPFAKKFWDKTDLLFPSTLTTSCKELTHWKRLWCWEGLGAGGEEDDRGWDGWMASLTQWTWIWVNSGSWWWTGRPGVLWFMGSQRVRHDWATELNWTDLKINKAGKDSTYNAGDPSLIPASGRSPGEGIGYPLQYSGASLVAQRVKNLPAMWETLQYSCLENSHGQRSLVD